MTRVLFLVPDLGASDAAAVVSLLAARLPADRFTSVVGLLTPTAGLPCGDWVTMPLHLRGPFDALGWWRRWNTLRTCTPDVIHAFGLDAVRTAQLAVLPGRGSRVRPKRVASFTGPISDGMDRWFTRLTLRAADRVVVSSQPESDRMAAIGVPADRVTVVPPGVATPLPAPDPIAFRRSLDIPDTARLVMAAGGFDAAAGLRTAVWAFDVVKYVAPDLYLVLIGDGPDRNRVERFGQAIGFDDYRIRFAGVRPDLSAVLRLAEIVWVTHDRGGVRIALDAMAAGRPVVAASTPDLAAVITDGVTGRLVGPRDRVRLAAVSHELLEHPDVAARLGATAQDRVVERFPVEGMVTRYAQVYDELSRGPAS